MIFFLKIRKKISDKFLKSDLAERQHFLDDKVTPMLVTNFDHVGDIPSLNISKMSPRFCFGDRHVKIVADKIFDHTYVAKGPSLSPISEICRQRLSASL